MKKLILSLMLFVSTLVGAQTFPVNNLQVNGTTNLVGAVTGPGLSTVSHTQTVPNVAALRAITCVPGLSYRTQGYSSNSDGGSGVYTCNGSDTTSPDDGCRIVASATYRYYLQYGAQLSVRQCGAKGDNASNDTVAFQNATAAGVTVYVPKGTYLINAILATAFNLVGDGSASSVIKPFNVATAALTYTSQTPQWAYHSSVKHIGFTYNGTARTGVGFTFGATSQAAYTAGMEFANNVDFYNVRFLSLQKGVQFPFGNIGSSFYDCGFSGNYYGAYLLDNKNYPAVSGSAAMHAGNKYFYSGEFDGNVVGVYVNNVTQGFGGLVFNGTIFEYNNVDKYVFTNNTLNPVSFTDTWSEGSGAFVSASQVLIDVFSGSTATPSLFYPHASIFDGNGSSAYLVRGGFFSDTYVKATSTRVDVEGSLTESASAYGGYPSQVDDIYSEIRFSKVSTSGGITMAARTVALDAVRSLTPNVTVTASAASRAFFSPARFNKSTGAFGGYGVTDNLTAASNLGLGSGLTVTNTTVSDGLVYGTSNRYSIPFTGTGQYEALITSSMSILSGTWCASTVDIKVVSGTPTFSSWDRGGNQLYAGVSLPETNVWYTLTGLGYFPNAISTFYGLDVSSSASGTAVIQMSAYQFRCFSTQRQAQDFIGSKVYVGP